MLDYSKRKCYGFIRTNDVEFIINSEEAATVNMIFDDFLDGKSLSQIVKLLGEKEILSPSGKNTWSRKVLSGILSNEKYHMYGVVSKETFDLVQNEKGNRTRTVQAVVTIVEVVETVSDDIVETTENEEIGTVIKNISDDGIDNCVAEIEKIPTSFIRLAENRYIVTVIENNKQLISNRQFIVFRKIFVLNHCMIWWSMLKYKIKYMMTVKIREKMINRTGVRKPSLIPKKLCFFY